MAKKLYKTSDKLTQATSFKSKGSSVQSISLKIDVSKKKFGKNVKKKILILFVQKLKDLHSTVHSLSLIRVKHHLTLPLPKPITYCLLLEDR